MRVFLCLVLFSFSICQDVEKWLTIKQRDFFPEGIAYSKQSNQLFLSSLFKSQIHVINLNSKAQKEK